MIRFIRKAGKIIPMKLKSSNALEGAAIVTGTVYGSDKLLKKYGVKGMERTLGTIAISSAVTYGLSRKFGRIYNSLSKFKRLFKGAI